MKSITTVNKSFFIKNFHEENSKLINKYRLCYVFLILHFKKYICIDE